jgi:uncharacterized protein (DUF697 family)
MSERTAEAERIVNRYWKWAAAAGLIPVPMIDIAAVMGVQLKMIADLSRVYGVPFQKDRVKSIVGALLGGASGAMLSAGALSLTGPALKVVPGVGTAVGVIMTPAANAAATYALGKVFIMHFESGGTLLDLNPDEMREHFRREMQAAPR